MNNFIKIKNTLPEGVNMIAVSKYQPNEHVMRLYESGQRVFGENKVQDLLAKKDLLPADIEWHFIGHLQTNKVKQIAPFIHLIQSVDSLKLLQEINKQGERNGRVIRCLLQFHVAEEETKFGFEYQEAVEMLASAEYAQLQNIEICGIMGMASNTERKDRIEKDFSQLQAYFKKIKTDYFAEKAYFSQLSMGMSSDYELALRYGATMIRLGSLIFSDL